MKKTTVLLLLLSALVLGANAQTSNTLSSLMGTWTTNMDAAINDEIRAGGINHLDLYYTFSDQNKLAVKVMVNLIDPNTGNYTLAVESTGSYTYSEANGTKTISLKPNKKMLTIRLDKVEWYGEIKEMAKNPEIDKMLRQTSEAAINKDKDMFASAYDNFTGTSTIVSVTANRLTIRDGSASTIVFTRVSK